MSKVLRLITDEVETVVPSPTSEYTFQRKKSHVIYRPQGQFLVICFVSHERDGAKIHEFAQEAINNDIGVVYLCDKLPSNIIHHKNIHYIVAPNAWLLHTLFFDPLQFSAVFSSKHFNNLAKAFSVFTGYNIPILLKSIDIKRQVKKYSKCKDNVLVEIVGGVGDHLMTIPTLKTLDSLGKRVFVVCEQQRQPCFENLPYIKGMFNSRKEVNMAYYTKVFYLHFGQHLNDYRLDVNKQNRIYSIANLCGLSQDELVIDKPEIILTDKEKQSVKKKYSIYPNKIFVGSDSARIDAKLPNHLTQNLINFLKNKRYTVFSASNRRHLFDNCIDLNKKLKIRDLFALIYCMDTVITVDTSFVHIAAAFDKKTICLMNYFKPEWRCGTYKSVEVFNPKVSCFPCLSHQSQALCDRKCTQKSCYEFYDWKKIKDTLYKRSDKILTINKKSGELKVNELSLPGKLFHYRNKPNQRIAVMWLGGIGDVVMSSYLCRAIKRKHEGSIIDVFVRDGTQIPLFIFDYPEIKAHTSKDGWDLTVNKLKKSYDVVYEFRPYPIVWFKDSEPIFFNKSIYDSWHKAAKEVLANSNKQTFKYYADTTGIVLNEVDMKIPLIKDDNYFNKMKQSYSLSDKYITINSGCDNNVGVMKLWSSEKWGELITKIKETGKIVFQVGDSNDANLPGADKIKCNNLIDLMYILQNSSLHIGNEGGLVHLAHSVGTKSIVLFGATNPTLFGYEDNINIYNSTCETCWWKTSDWSKKCLKGNKTCTNLENISAEEVFSYVEKNYE